MLVPEGETKEFLGQEFLTWLWYYGENNNWKFSMTDGDVHYGMDELLSLESDAPVSKQRLSGPVPTNTPEARVGLSEGKKVDAARMVLVYRDREWTFTCNANDFKFSSLNLMKPTTANIEDRFTELVADLEDIAALFDHIYRCFLEIRLSPAWEETELPSMRKWIERSKPHGEKTS